MPDARDLCTLAQVIAFAPGYTLGAETDTEAQLATLITEQSREWVEYTGREVKAIGSQPATRVYPIGSWEVDSRELAIHDATTITAINLTDQSGNVLQALDSTAWVTLPRLRDDWEPITSLEFPRYVLTPAGLRRNTLAAVTGTFGFPSLPATVSGAVARLVIWRYLADVTNTGTVFADAASANGSINPAASRAAALDVRERFRRYVLA